MPIEQAEYLLCHILQTSCCKIPLLAALIEEHRWNLAQSWSLNTKVTTDRSSTEHSPLNTVPHWFWQLTAKADLYLLVSFWVCKVWWTQILSFYSGTAKKKHALKETSLSSKLPSAKQRQVTFPNYFSPHETGKAEAVKYGEFLFSHSEGNRIKFQKGLNSFSSTWRVENWNLQPSCQSCSSIRTAKPKQCLEMLQSPQQSPSTSCCLLKVIWKFSMKTMTRMTEDHSAY